MGKENDRNKIHFGTLQARADIQRVAMQRRDALLVLGYIKTDRKHSLMKLSDDFNQVWTGISPQSNRRRR